MTLLIQDGDVQKLLPMKDCIDAMEDAFREFDSGVAVNWPRIRLDSQTSTPGMRYYINTHIGTVPQYGTACLRIGNRVSPVRISGAKRRPDFIQPAKRDWDLILLYSLETGEPLAIIHGFTLSGVRVAATTALAVKYLARDNAKTLGILGTGRIARRTVEAISVVHRINKVKVYSPSEQHREDFREEISKALGLEVLLEADPRRVVEDADILCCATRSLEPVFHGEWLVPGQLVTTIVNSDVLGRKTEADEVTFTRSDVIVINDKDSVFSNRQTELLEPIEKGLFSWDKVRELGGIVTGRFPGRSSMDELIYYKNNTGMAIQFAAAGALIYQEALKRKIGKELPTEWFGTDLTRWYEKGYYPSS